MIRIYCFILLVISISCKKAVEKPADSVNESRKGPFTFQFDLKVGGKPFYFDTAYVNDAGEKYRIQEFNFFLSNIRLERPDGSTYSVPESYHLVKLQDLNTLRIENIPAGTYSSISFSIGVDSARNVSGVQRGDLDPAVAGGMFWDWNTGYVFLMVNGTSPASPQPGGVFMYHVSGFRKEGFAMHTITSAFDPSIMEIRPGAVPNLHYYVQVDQIFKDPYLISIAEYNVVMTGDKARILSENYKDIFQLQHIEN